MRISNHYRRSALRQRGAALVVSLILLAVLTILALSASQTTRLQERMAGNIRNSELAFQNAEAGMRAAERFVEALDFNAPPKGCSSAPCDFYSPGTLPTNLQDQPTSWWSTNGKEYGTSGNQEMTGVAGDPFYVIELLDREPLEDLGNSPQPPRMYYFRITASAPGGTNQAVATVQTTFSKLFAN